MTKKEEKKLKTSKNQVEKKQSKKKEKEEKISVFSRLKNFFKGVKTEAKRIKWPSKKDMLKYSIATIVFIVVCSLFFYAIDIIIAFLHTLGK